MSDLLYEASHERELPDAFRYHATARYRLKTRSVIARGVSHARFEASTEMLKTHFLCSENIGKLLQTPCERGGGARTRLDPCPCPTTYRTQLAHHLAVIEPCKPP